MSVRILRTWPHVAGLPVDMLSTTTAEVFWTCHLHALSTEVEEIMGLLLGDILVRAVHSLMVQLLAVHNMNEHFCISLRITVV